MSKKLKAKKRKKEARRKASKKEEMRNEELVSTEISEGITGSEWKIDLTCGGVKEEPKKSWEINDEDKRAIEEKSAKVAKAIQEDQEFYEFAKKYTNNFQELLASRDVDISTGRRNSRPKAKAEDMDKFIRLSDLINKLDLKRVNEEESLSIAYNAGRYNDIERRIIYSRLNAINPNKYPKLEDVQK